MTLFRKVFLNQARPASPEEVLDETAIRDAFRAGSGSVEPLILDPFARVNLIASEQAPLPAPRTQAKDQTASVIASGTAQDDLVDHAAAMDGLQETVQEEEETEATVAEISAALQRAMDQETEAVEEHAAGVEDVPELAAEDTQDADLEDMAAADAQNLLEDTSVPEDMPQDSDTAAQTPEAETFDLAAFAQRQMQALNTGLAPLPERMENAPEGSEDTALDDMPAPAAGRAGRRAGRVKTRLLGFNRADMHDNDPFSSAAETTATAQREKFPVGWLVVVEGPGVGHSFSLFTGASMIGRGEDQVIRLDFGDNSISRQNHAAIAYDEEQNKFYLGHGGKSNIIRRNARPVLSTEELHHADLIRIGETTLRFVALCGSDFQWDMRDGSNAAGL